MGTFRFCRLVSLLLLMVAIPSTNLLAQQHLADETNPGTSPSAIPPIKTLEQYATYWSSEPGWDTELQLKNNLASEPLAVTPILRMASGREISLTPVTIPANTSVSVRVNEGLKQHALDVLGQPGSYGSVILRFVSSNVP